MKVIISLCLLLFALNTDAQKKNLKLLEERFGSINLKYSKTIDLESQDTTYFLILLFQNAKYTAIVDIQSIYFAESSKLIEFVNDLKSAYGEMEGSERVSISWDKKDYKIRLYEFSKNLYLVEGGSGEGYTTLNKKNTLQLITQLKRIQFGKDEILPE